MPPRRCRHCRQLVAAGVRCPCAPSTRTGYDNAERRRRAQLVADHLEAYGPVCPGWRREMHEVDPSQLTADHVVPVAAGGDPRGTLQALCRSCNSSRGARTH
jgi:5-methylcytosine-specific restriction protein A